MPVGGEDVRPLPGERLQRAVVPQDGELDGLPGWVETDGELRLALGVGDADEVPPASRAAAAVAERGHEAELLGEALGEERREIFPLLYHKSMYATWFFPTIFFLESRTWLNTLSVGMTRFATASILYAVCILFDPLTRETPGYPSRLTSSSNLRMKSKF